MYAQEKDAFMPTALEAKVEAAALEAQLQREQRATARGAKQRRLDEHAEERLKTLNTIYHDIYLLYEVLIYIYVSTKLYPRSYFVLRCPSLNIQMSLSGSSGRSGTKSSTAFRPPNSSIRDRRL